jgi:hypothetical protein
VNENRTCLNCKHFFRVPIENQSECRLNPPVTTVFIIGADATGKPVWHKHIGFPHTTPGLWCGQWALKIERATEMPR